MHRILEFLSQRHLCSENWIPWVFSENKCKNNVNTHHWTIWVWIRVHLLPLKISIKWHAEASITPLIFKPKSFLKQMGFSALKSVAWFNFPSGIACLKFQLSQYTSSLPKVFLLVAIKGMSANQEDSGAIFQECSKLYTISWNCAFIASICPSSLFCFQRPSMKPLQNTCLC